MAHPQQQQWRGNHPAVRRIMQEIRELQEDTSTDFVAEAFEDDIFEFAFVVRGPPDTEFEGGLYHGRILLPPEYPFKPPSFTMLTPSGRFQTNVKICLSISSHHPEHWQPSWSVRTALTALVAFMPSPGGGALGSLDYTPEERRQLAAKSRLAAPRVASPARQKLLDALHARMLAAAPAAAVAAGAEAPAAALARLRAEAEAAHGGGSGSGSGGEGSPGVKAAAAEASTTAAGTSSSSSSNGAQSGGADSPARPSSSGGGTAPSADAAAPAMQQQQQQQGAHAPESLDQEQQQQQQQLRRRAAAAAAAAVSAAAAAPLAAGGVPPLPLPQQRASSPGSSPGHDQHHHTHHHQHHHHHASAHPGAAADRGLALAAALLSLAIAALLLRKLAAALGGAWRVDALLHSA